MKVKTIEAIEDGHTVPDVRGPHGLTMAEVKAGNRWLRMPDGTYHRRTDEEISEAWAALSAREVEDD